jgi:hypothetical protein
LTPLPALEEGLDMTRKLQSRWAWGGAVACAAGLVALPFVGNAVAPAPADAMVQSANKLIAALTAEQKKRALWAWEDASRTEWHFIPKERAGLPLKAMDAKQRELAHGLFKSGLSQAGYTKATQIIELEKVLAEIEKNPVRRDPELYHFWIFGKPEAKGTWGWRVEGHHLSLHFTVVKGSVIATTPAFMGANPAEVRDGPLKGRRVLRAEEDLARELLASFDDKTRAQVVFDAKAPDDILTKAESKVGPLDKAGVLAKSMSKEQKDLLRKILLEYAGAMPPRLAEERLAKVDKAGFDNLSFAWAGGPKRGDPHYYRIQGPTFVVEYDNTQNGANHVHSVWRDFDGDFGRDLLREHIKAAHP